MKHRKKWFLVFLLAGIILMMVPFSIAYLTHVETRENRITIGQNDVMIEEGFHTSQAVAAGDDVRKGREGPQYRQRPLLYPRLRSAFRYGHPCAYGLRYEGLDTGR